MQKKSQHLNEKIDAKMLLAVLGICLLAAVPLRIVQLFTNIEPSSGFFEAMDWTVYVSAAVLVAVTLVLSLLPRFSARIPASRPVVMRHRPLAVMALLFAVGIATDVSFTLVRVLHLTEHIGTAGFVRVLFTEGVFSMILQMICGILACIYILLVALSYLGEKATYTEYRFLALMPLFWVMFRLVGRFMTKISFLMVSELVLELLMLSFMMLFSLSFARVSAQINQKHEMRKVFCYGLPAAGLALLVGVSRLVLTVGGKGSLLANGFAFNLSDLTFGLFAATYLYVHMQYGRPASEDAWIADEAPDAQTDEKAEAEDPAASDESEAQ